MSEATIASIPLKAIDVRAAKAWFARFCERDLTKHTKHDVLNQVRQTFEGAREIGLIEFNPFEHIRMPRWRPNQRGWIKQAWTVLEPHEQIDLLRAIPQAFDRRMVAFALGTGMRRGEQWALRRAHVFLGGEPFIHVMHGGPDGRPTKSGVPRDVPLLGFALLAARSQVQTIGEAPDAVMWPAARGGYRDNKIPSKWAEWLNAAGIDRRVRWHDLRHTCAASLVSGWWGRAWSLEEVKELLGHSSITITERYAHFAKNVLTDAARETRAHLAQAKGLLP